MGELRPQTTLFCAVFAFAIALSMLLRGRRAVHFLFAAFATTLAFWYASQSLYGLFQAPIWVRSTGILTVFLPQFAVRLFQAVVPLEGTERSRLRGVAAVLGFPVLGIVLSPYQETSLALGMLYCYVFGLLVAALVELARRGRKSPSRAVRERVRFLVVVGALATTFTLADFLSFMGVRLPPIGAVLSIVFLFVLAESLTRPRLADLYEMSGRLVVATAVACCLAGIFYLFASVIGRFSTMYLNAVLAAIVFLVLFEPLQHEVETRINRVMFTERRALETIVTDLRQRLAHVLETERMVQLVLDGFERSHRVTSGAIYLADADGNGFDLAGGVGAPAPRRLERVAIHPLLDRLHSHPSLSLEDALKRGDASVATAASALDALGTSVLLALRGEQAEVVGLVCVADDRVRDAFTPEEITLLETLAAQVSVAIANTRIYSRMKERDRLAALGAMAAGLAHEVKNPLGSIKGAAQVLEELTSSDTEPASKEFIGIIVEEVNRLDRVVGSFLDYARPHAGNPIPIDVNAAVRRTLQILASQQSERTEVHIELAENLPRAKIDPEKLRQVLMNLIQNAIHAMDGRGRITVTTTLRRSGRSGRGGGAPPSDRLGRSDEVETIELSVRDTGPGISQKVLKNLFVPFFTTKAQGTGLGLALSQSIVQNAGGAIHVQTQSGSGTTFTIALPVASDALSTPLPAEARAGGQP